jgi:hypothetical protein
MQKISAGKFHVEPRSRFTSLNHLVGDQLQGIAPLPQRFRKKERSGLQSACDELIDKGAIITGLVGCMYPELGEFHPVIVGWSTRNRPLLPSPSMILPDARHYDPVSLGAARGHATASVAASRAW